MIAPNLQRALSTWSTEIRWSRCKFSAIPCNPRRRARCPIEFGVYCDRQTSPISGTWRGRFSLSAKELHRCLCPSSDIIDESPQRSAKRHRNGGPGMMHHGLASFSVDLGPNGIGNPNVRFVETGTRSSNVSKWPDGASRPGAAYDQNRAIGPPQGVVRKCEKPATGQLAKIMPSSNDEEPIRLERAAIRARARTRTFAWHVQAGAYSGVVPRPLDFNR